MSTPLKSFIFYYYSFVLQVFLFFSFFFKCLMDQIKTLKLNWELFKKMKFKQLSSIDNYHWFFWLIFTKFPFFQNWNFCCFVKYLFIRTAMTRLIPVWFHDIYFFNELVANISSLPKFITKFKVSVNKRSFFKKQQFGYLVKKGTC